MLKDFGCQDNSEPQIQKLACVGVFSILTTRSKNDKEDTEGCCGDYLRVHILFLEYEWANVIWVHVKNCFQQSRLEKKRKKEKKLRQIQLFLPDVNQTHVKTHTHNEKIR